jgi:hypothetical protein
MPEAMNANGESLHSFRPADVCRALLAALEASEGRRRNRKRDQTPDAIGLAVKREVLEQVVQDDPDSEMFEGWLLHYSQKNESKHSLGAVSAMARAVLDEWRLAHSMHDFKAWLDRGAPSDDADAGPATPRA